MQVLYSQRLTFIEDGLVEVCTKSFRDKATCNNFEYEESDSRIGSDLRCYVEDEDEDEDED